MTQALSNLPDRLPPSDDNPPFPPLGLWQVIFTGNKLIRLIRWLFRLGTDRPDD